MNTIAKALEGLKVLDFTWVAAGPLMTLYLANFGGTVISVETQKRIDPLRTVSPFKDQIPGINRSGAFALFNTDTYGVTLNLDHPKGIEIAKKLISWADIVVDNFRAGTMKRWGLTYEEIKKIKPDIIMLSATMLGQNGPRSAMGGYGGQLQSLSGFTYLSGWPDRVPTSPWSAYTDVLSARLGVITLVAALIHRLKEGEGQYFDLSEFEAAIYFLIPFILDYVTNGRIANRMGNSHPYMVPHGAYPCRGEDKWCVIAVSTDEEWRSLCDAMGNPRWTKEHKFSTVLERKKNEGELDTLIGQWTRELAAHEVMARLQQAGVSAGVVKDVEELLSDPQLLHREYFKRVTHPEIGEYSFNLPSSKLSTTPADVRMPAPCLGEHNEFVYTKIIGIPDDEFIQLLSEGVFD